MNSAVIDASVAAAWLLPDEQASTTDGVIFQLSTSSKLVPSIFWCEIRNILLLAERRRRIRPDQADSLLEGLSLLNLQDAGYGTHEQSLVVARRHNLTAYDAASLVLASSTRAGLATLDRRLGQAALRENISLLGPLAA